MARTLASLPTGSRVTDYISLGVVSRAIPREKIDSILASTGKASVRQRELPAHLVVYYVIALALYMQSSSGSAALLAGRHPVADQARGNRAGHRQERHFASALPSGRGTLAATVSAGSCTDRFGKDARGAVSNLATG